MKKEDRDFAPDKMNPHHIFHEDIAIHFHVENNTLWFRQDDIRQCLGIEEPVEDGSLIDECDFHLYMARHRQNNPDFVFWAMTQLLPVIRRWLGPMAPPDVMKLDERPTRAMWLDWKRLNDLGYSARDIAVLYPFFTHQKISIWLTRPPKFLTEAPEWEPNKGLTITKDIAEAVMYYRREGEVPDRIADLLDLPTNTVHRIFKGIHPICAEMEMFTRGRTREEYLAWLTNGE